METKITINYRNNKLKSIRKQNNMSQSELAKIANISVRVYQCYEQGSRDISCAKLSTLLQICLALNCNIEDIITDPDTTELLEKYTNNQK